MSEQLLLFKQEGQHVYDYTNVYDPDVDGSDPSTSGKIVPAVRSIVFDNRTTQNRALLVKAVDPITYKVTYQDFPYKVIDSKSVILNYGNDVFMLYYDNRTTPTRLTVDSKMILFGTNIATYRLVKDSAVISSALEQAENGVAASTSIPVAEVTNQYVEGIRRCNTCYTTSVLSDGDLVTLELYDSVGVLVGEVELVAKKATILNTLSAATNPITGFTADCNQKDGEDWYLYRGQAKSNLSVYPTITFANGSSFVVPVDGASCFIYGLEDVDTDVAGTRNPILVKYYLNDRYQVAPSLNVVAGTKRVLYSQHILKIVDKPIESISKLSVIPIWKQATLSYDLAFLAYTTNRQEPDLVTSRIVNTSAAGVMTFKSGVITSGSFNPKLFGTAQTFKIRFAASEIGSFVTNYEQEFKITLKDPSTIPTVGNGRELWTIEDPSNTNEPYGIDDATYNRPEIKWDATAGKHFFDSTNQFTSSEVFLNTFYRLADPPYLQASETQAPTPNKFRIKDIDGNVLVASLSISSYHRGFVINRVGTETPLVSSSLTVNGNTFEVPEIVIVEFLYENSVVYGVPAILTNANNQYVVAAGD